MNLEPSHFAVAYSVGAMIVGIASFWPKDDDDLITRVAVAILASFFWPAFAAAGAVKLLRARRPT